MKKTIALMGSLALPVMMAMAETSVRSQEPAGFRRIAVREYCEKMKAGWIGKMVGCAWGAPTEFKFKEKIVPEDKMPKWDENFVNKSDSNDDLYVQMTFMESLDKYGLGVSQRQAGIDFANSTYKLWHANKAGRDNLRKGIAPPDSGHPKFNSHADDIDYQIEADFAGLASPGLPNLCIELGEKFGRLMNYGDGVYGGQWVSAMYAEAFFESDPARIVQAGLKCIPEKSQYHEAIADVLKWHQADPDNWEKTWQLVEDKYQKNKDYRRSSCDKGVYNIDAKLNGAYIAIGMLYGKGDLDKTIIIATRCGQDSDCNPGNAAGPMFTTVPFSKLAARYAGKLDQDRVFQGTTITPKKLFAATEKIAREAVVKYGGKIEKDANGEEVFVIPIQTPKPIALEQCWEPGNVANSKFTEEEIKQIKAPAAPR
ncbi:MAG: ADP-ribosylglycohydrolase family protein [Candidatus Sumerlaeota bacterium]|nr:ADP-ribosylglycohydrolase family protein [Candidatus Sumerlaeota bacterium]